MTVDALYTVVQVQLACDLAEATTGPVIVTAIGPDSSKAVYRTSERPQMGDRVRVTVEPLR